MARKVYRPHQLEWPPTPEQWAGLNDVIEDLYRLLRPINSDAISAVAASGVSAGTYGSGGTASGSGSHTQDTFANRPAAAAEGAIFLPTDGFTLDIDDGSAWDPWGPIFPFTPPVDGDFAWINQGTASVDADKNAIHLLSPADTTPNLRIRVKTAPSTPYVITACILSNTLAKNAHAYGLVLRESATEELHLFDCFTGAAGTLRLASRKFTNPTTFSADYQLETLHAPLHWMRIADDGVDRICSYSVDGQHWIEFHSVTRTDFLTADQVGFFVNGQNVSPPNLPAAITLLSWQES